MAFKCSVCPAEYDKKPSLNKHILRKHKNLNVKPNNFVCDWCKRIFKSNLRLNKHFQLCPCNEFRVFKCDRCDEEYTKKGSLQKHIRRKHALGSVNILICDICGKHYKTEISWKTHVRSCTTKINDIFECDICGRRCKFRQNLIYHIRNKHSETNRVQQANFKCPICGYAYFVKDPLLRHFETEHNIRLEIRNLEFSNVDEFSIWLNATEEKTHNRYVREGPSLRYKCHRSGFEHNRYRGERSKWLKGTKKINGYCPSEIKCKFVKNSAKMTVHFVATHVAHGNDIQFMGKTKRPPSNSFAERSAAAPTDLEIWLTERINTLFYFKKPNQIDEQYPNLKREDYVLMLVNEHQMNMLDEYGDDVIMVGGTREAECNFELTIIQILDELRQEVPICFAFSNRKDEHVYEVLFRELSSVSRKLKPNVLMSAATIGDEVLNAWQKVMDPPEKYLLCSGCVTETWRKSLTKVKGGIEKRKFVNALLKKIQTELDPMSFHEMLNSFLNGDGKEDEDLAEVLEYFRGAFSQNVTSWAYCYRQYAGINVNLYSRNFFQKLKESNLHTSSADTVNDLLPVIDFTFRHFYLVEFTKLRKVQLAFKIKAIRRRHRKSVNASVDSIIEVDKGWYVPSKDYNAQDVDMDNMYFVEQIVPECSCKLRCFPCGICIHQFHCSCLDYSINSNLCEHVHLIGKLRKSCENLQCPLLNK